MTRSRLATVLGLLVASSSSLVMLAGSDLPPPPGFVLVVALAVGVGLLVRAAIPRLLATNDRAGSARAVTLAIGAGVAAGIVVGLLFAALGSGEPSIPEPDAPKIALFVLVAAVAAGISAGAVTVLAILADRAHSRPTAILTITVPGILVLLLPGVVIAARVPT